MRLSPAKIEYLAHKRETGLRLGQALIDLELVSQADISEALRRQGKVNCISLRMEIVDPEAVRQLDEEFCRKNSAIPVNVIAGITTVAMKDPADVYVIDELVRLLGSRVIPVYAEPGKILECLDEVFGRLEQDGEPSLGLEEIVGNVSAGEVLLEAGRQDRTAEVEEEDLDGPVVTVISAIFKEAIEAGASDIHLEPRGETFVVRFRVDGSLYERMSLKKGWARPCLSRLKVISNLDIAQRRLPQDGRARISVGSRQIDLRISTMPTLLGEGAVVRILDGGRSIRNIAGLGMRAEQEERLRRSIQCSDGILLATGPTGSGKTTTLYALLETLNNPTRKIITLEDPVENRLDSVCQINTNAKAGLTFARGLRSILRQDPDIVLVGEIRDAETAQIAVQAALTGHIVLSTLHTIGATETITRLREMGVEQYLLGDTIRGIIAQRLLRKLCPHCRVTDPNPLVCPVTGHSSQEVTIFRATGCERCRNTGYLGRIGIHEIVLPSARFREALCRGADAEALRVIACEEGMTTLREEAMRAVAEGKTSVEEVFSTVPMN